MKIGTRVKVVALPSEEPRFDPILAAVLAPYLGKIGIVETRPDISGGMWVNFGENGAIFEARELEVQ